MKQLWIVAVLILAANRSCLCSSFLRWRKAKDDPAPEPSPNFFCEDSLSINMNGKKLRFEGDHPELGNPDDEVFFKTMEEWKVEAVRDTELKISKYDRELRGLEKKKSNDVRKQENIRELRMKIEKDEEYLRLMKAWQVRDQASSDNWMASRLEELYGLISEERELNLPRGPDTDEYLRGYLRRVRFRPDVAFKRIKLYYKMAQDHPEYFEDISVDNQKEAMNNQVFTLFPVRDQHGRRTLLIRARMWKENTYTLRKMLRMSILFLFAAATEPRTTIAGVTVLIDSKDDPLSHTSLFVRNRAFVAMARKLAHDAISVEIKAIYMFDFVIPRQAYIYVAIELYRAVVADEESRKKLHTGRDKLLKELNAEAIPVVYGGNLNINLTMDGQMIYDLVKNYENKFSLINAFGYPPLSKQTLEAKREIENSENDLNLKNLSFLREMNQIGAVQETKGNGGNSNPNNPPELIEDMKSPPSE